MGTRGAFGVIINEKEKIGYNQFDSYPEGMGIENLRWLREELNSGREDDLRALAEAARLVIDEEPTEFDIHRLASVTDLRVSEQSTKDWYCLTRETHGKIGEMLKCGYICDNHLFPIDSLFCEWAYIVDFDKRTFEVYEGFRTALPTEGRWAGRPTAEEDRHRWEMHLKWCAENDREPWMPEASEYKAVQLLRSWPFDSLPTDEEFLAWVEMERLVEQGAGDPA